MIKRVPLLILLLSFCLIWGNGSSRAQSPLVIGLNYAPVQPTSSATSPLTDDQVAADLDLIAPKFTTIRIYQAQALGDQIVRLAADRRIDVVVGTWLTDDSAANDAEIASAINIANNYANVAGVIVGSGVLERGDLTGDQLTQYVQRVREAIPPSIPVGYADVFLQWVQNPTLAAAVDWVGLNSYGFLDCQSMQGAIQYSINQWALLVSNPAFSGTEIVLTETGYPTDGVNPNCQGQTAPSPDAQAQFVDLLISNATAAQLNSFISEFADSAWRCSDPSGYACHWGLVDAERTPKAAWDALADVVRPAPPQPIIAQVESDNRSSVNCRVEPGLEQTVDTLIDNGEQVEIVDRSSVEEWVKVDYADHECWVHHSLLIVDGRPVPPASQVLDLGTSQLSQFVENTDAALCPGITPGELANATWSAPDIVTMAACVRNLQTWLPDAQAQQDRLIAADVCSQAPSAAQADLQNRFQNIWALDNAAIAYYNLGRALRREGQFQLAEQAFSTITDDLSCAWAYDSSSEATPFFWSVANEAQSQLDSLPLETEGGS